MVAIPYLFDEVARILGNTPLYALILETILLAAVIWLLLHKRGGQRRLTKEEEERIIANYEPEPLVAEVDSQHPLLSQHLVQSKVGKYVTINGKKCLNLASHNYLGLLQDEKIKESACKALRKYGVGSCGPRGFYGTMDVHLELEERLAKFMGTEEAAVYSYGFSTISSAIPAYAKRGNLIFADQAVNFAIQKGFDASRSVIYYFKHNDMQDLERLLKEQEQRDIENPKKAAKTRRFLVVEGIYMNTGDICPLPEIIKMRAKYKLRLFIDESVSFGTLGKTGRGVTEHFNVNLDEVDLIMASMENALGTIGGFCVGSHFIIEHQRLSGLGYCFSASLPPLLARAAIAALDRLEREPQMFTELQNTCQSVHTKFEKFSSLQLFGSTLSPVKHLYITANFAVDVKEITLKKIENLCLEKGLAVLKARYLYNLEHKPPQPSLRIVVNRLLTESDIQLAFDIIENIANEYL